MPYLFERNFFDYFNSLKRLTDIQPVKLGGYSGASGGGGGNPGGFIGVLPQSKVAYDTSELGLLETGTPPSLWDNLNHIRYRLSVLESGPSVSGLIVRWEGDDIVFPTDTLDFYGDVTVIDSGSGVATITVSGGGGSVSFLGLTDTPDDYTGDARKLLRVNAGQTAVEFIPTMTATDSVLSVIATGSNTGQLDLMGGSSTWGGYITLGETGDSYGEIYADSSLFNIYSLLVPLVVESILEDMELRAYSNSVDTNLTVYNPDGSKRMNSEFRGDVEIEDQVILGVSELTIASGIVTSTRSFHRIDTESDAGSDDLDTINGGVTGTVLILRAENDARTVVVKNGTGNIRLSGATDYTMDNNFKTLTLIYDGSNWLETARGNN